ncbi:MAG: uncharacterized protein QOJ03_1949, partial [Frankiaceae bacterium]|nr:uncharacterized protein [Frankiaceae bacterium]
MAFKVPTPRLPHLGGRGRLAVPLVAALVLLIIVAAVFVSIYTDLLWFRSVGYSTVFSRRLTTRVLLFVVFGLLMAVTVGANVVVAHRLRPPFRPISPEQEQLETLRVAIHPYRYWLMGAALLLIGAITGAAAASRWRTWMLWRNGVHFGINDPQFHKDVSYFAFTYPFQRFILGMLFA